MVFKCKMCGGELEFVEDDIYICMYCGTKQTLPNNHKEKYNSTKEQGYNITKEKQQEEPKKEESEKRTSYVNGLLERAFICLGYCEWSKAEELLEQVLNIEPQNAEAYIGKMMADLRVSHKNKLPQCERLLTESPNYEKAERFADKNTRSILKYYNEAIMKRKAEQQRWEKEEIYRKACEDIDSDSIEKMESAIEQFETIQYYRDSRKKIELCRAMIKAKQEEEIKLQKEKLQSQKAGKTKKKKGPGIGNVIIVICTLLLVLIALCCMVGSQEGVGAGIIKLGNTYESTWRKLEDTVWFGTDEANSYMLHIKREGSSVSVISLDDGESHNYDCKVTMEADDEGTLYLEIEGVMPEEKTKATYELRVTNDEIEQWVELRRKEDQKTDFQYWCKAEDIRTEDMEMRQRMWTEACGVWIVTYKVIEGDKISVAQAFVDKEDWELWIELLPNGEVVTHGKYTIGDSWGMENGKFYVEDDENGKVFLTFEDTQFEYAYPNKDEVVIFEKGGFSVLEVLQKGGFSILELMEREGISSEKYLDSLNESTGY